LNRVTKTISPWVLSFAFLYRARLVAGRTNVKQLLVSQPSPQSCPCDGSIW
jgi:hypothetical protein